MKNFKQFTDSSAINENIDIADILKDISESLRISMSNIENFKSITIYDSKNYFDISVQYLMDGLLIDKMLKDISDIKNIINKNFTIGRDSIQSSKELTHRIILKFFIKNENFKNSNIYKSMTTIDKYKL